MKTLTEIIKSLNDASFQVGEFEGLEICTNDESHIIVFDGTFEKEETYVIDATYLEPKEIGVKESREISNVKLFAFNDYFNEEEGIKLTPSELDRLVTAIKSIINIEY